MLDAARMVIAAKGDAFTTQELAAAAGVSLQTFYRYFASKDQLFIAVIGDSTVDVCERWTTASLELPDPLSRLRYHITSPIDRLASDTEYARIAQFVVSARWRLHRLYPTELAAAEKPFVEMLRKDVDAAIESGELDTPDAAWSSWLLAELIRSVYHYYAFSPHSDADMERVKEQMWRFCLRALGGRSKR